MFENSASLEGVTKDGTIDPVHHRNLEIYEPLILSSFQTIFKSTPS